MQVPVRICVWVIQLWNCLSPHFLENTTPTEHMLSATALGIPCLSPQLEFCISYNSLTSRREKIFSTQISLQLCLSDWIKQLHFYREHINKIIIVWPLRGRTPPHLLESTHSQARLSSSCTTAFCFTAFLKERKGHSQFKNISCTWGTLKNPVSRVFPFVKWDLSNHLPSLSISFVFWQDLGLITMTSVTLLLL